MMRRLRSPGVFIATWCFGIFLNPHLSAGEPSHTFQHAERIRCVAISPDGNLIASGGEKLVVRNLKTGQTLINTKLRGVVWSVKFSRDGRKLAVTNHFGPIAVWDLNEKKPILAIRARHKRTNDVDFSPDGKLLASADQNLPVLVFKTTTSKVGFRLVGMKTERTALRLATMENGLRRAALIVPYGFGTAGRVNLFARLKVTIGMFLASPFDPTISSWPADRTTEPYGFGMPQRGPR